MLALNFCLPQFEAEKFLEALRKGDIDPYALSELSSAERRTFFTKYMNDAQAKSVNTLFESKLLLKNQQQGLITWAKQVAGLKPKARTELIDRIMRMPEALLSPADEQAFLADLAEQKLGVGVTMEEAQKISDLTNAVAKAKNKMQLGGDKLEYGRARVALDNYISDLKVEAQKGFKSVGETLVNAAGTTKAIRASFDNSAIFRQGWKTLMTDPGLWAKNAVTSFSDLVRTVGGKAVMDEVKADIFSRPNYDLYREAKLAVGTIEEAYPTSLPGKVPVLGRLYKGSETAYTGFVYKMRADIFDKYAEIAKESGVDLSNKAEVQAIGKLVNSLTGRGSLDFGAAGSLEGGAAKAINNVFFSPRFIKSNIDVLTAHLTDTGMTSFARKQAAINLVKIVSGTAAILTLANAVAPGSVEWDPRSSDFGKIKIGATRFDVTGGMSSLVVLAAREIAGAYKNPTTGKVSQLNTGVFGEKTRLDEVVNFFTNKASPVGTVAVDWLRGHDYNNQKFNLGTEAQNLATPLVYSNYEELKSNPNSANKLAAMIADALGISTNTYSK